MRSLILTDTQVYMVRRKQLMVGKRVFSQNSDTSRSPLKTGTTLPRVKGRTLQAGRTGRSVTRGASVNKRGKK